MCAYIVKNQFGKNVNFLGRVKTIGELQLVASKVGFLCKGCGIAYETRPKNCTNKECGGSDFKKIADGDQLDDQRFITVALVKDDTDASTEEELVLCDLRHVEATEIDFTFNDVLELGGEVLQAETTEKKIIKDFETFFLYVKVDSLKKVNADFVKKTVQVTDDERAEITEYVQAHRPTIKDELVSSFAAHLHGLENIKEFAIKQIIGAKYKDAGIRTDLHGLIIGPPGTGKSEILEEAALVAQGVYQSAEKITGAGIVAGLERNEKTGMHDWQAGIALLTENLKALDEIDKNKTPGIYDSLVTVLNSGVCTIRKIRSRDFQTPGPWLFGANPKKMKYDYYKTVPENVPVFSEALFNRLDAIFITNDDYNEAQTDAVLDAKDKKATGHLVAPINRERLMKMLVVMREHEEVCILPEAFAVLRKYFHDMKKNSYQNGSGLVITPRQYDGLIRLSVANAKMLLKDCADAEDAQTAVKCYEEWLAKIVVDPATGRTDFGVTEQNRTATQINVEKLVEGAIKTQTQNDRVFKAQSVVDKIIETGKATEPQVREILKSLEQEGRITKMPNDHYMRTK